MIDKASISKVYRQLNCQKQNKKQSKQWAEELNRHCSKEMINKHMEKCLTSVIVRELHQNYNEVSPPTG